MSTLALTKADFMAQLPFSAQIEEAQYRPFVHLAYSLDLLPLLGHATLEKVDALDAFTVREYTPGLSVAANDLLARRERLYRAKVDGPTLAPPPLEPDADPAVLAAEWAYEPLLTLWHFHLKRWWVWQSFARFLGQHGLNITKAGITLPKDGQLNTYERPTSAQLAGLQAQVDTTAEALRSALTRFLRAEHLLYQSDPAFGYCYGDGLLGDAYGPLTDAERLLLLPAANHASHRRHTRRLRGV